MLRYAINIAILLVVFLIIVIYRFRFNGYIKGLEKYKEAYTLLIENLNDIIVKTDKDGIFQFASPSFYTLMGKNEAEFIGKPFIPTIHDEDREDAEKAINDLVGPIQSCSIEHRVMTKDGWKWIGWTGKPLFHTEGNITGYIGVGRVISKRKRAEEELKRSNAILRAQQEASIDGTLVIDEKRTVLSFNQRFIKMWNIPAGKVLNHNGKKLLSYILPTVKNRREIVSTAVYLTKKPLESRRFEICLNDGRTLDCYTAPVLSSQRNSYGRVWFLRDITDEKKVEEILRLNAEENQKLLKEAIDFDRVKTEFFCNISHELRTPLNIIFSTLQLMEFYNKNNYILDSKNMLGKYIGTMKQNCQRLLRLINNLIDMTKIDSGYFQIHLRNCNIVSLIEEITLSVAGYISNKSISLLFDTDTEEKIVACDADKIERIMLNLLSNAVKFTKAGGQISVSLHDNGERVEISVKDTGIGIPEDKLGIVFERFRQVNSSLTRDHEGSGIGLSLVKSLVEMHGGRVYAKSTCGLGSEFVVELPVRVTNKENMRDVDINVRKNCIDRINIEFSDIYT